MTKVVDQNQAVLQHCDRLLQAFSIDDQMQMLQMLVQQIQKKKRTQKRAVYARTRYHGDPDYRKRHNEKKTKRTVHKYGTDAEWRARIREQQGEYYHRSRAEKTSPSPDNI